MRHIALLGSTGSIGRNTLDVVRANRDRFTIVSLAAGSNIEILAKQIGEFGPRFVSVKQATDAAVLAARFPTLEIGWGESGLLAAVDIAGVDTVVAAMGGTVGLPATLQAISKGKRICLANKETLVAAGDVINRALDESRAELIPIDSEESAIFQSIGANSKEHIRKIILTASGGPFFTREHAAFAAITIEETMAHPIWNMGVKITVDSATLMNKALEILETRYLFRVEPLQIAVLIHPQSIVHSMVEFVDSSTIAQLSVPDMRIPILYALTYPERIPGLVPSLHLAEIRQLEFFAIDETKFPSIPMAYQVMRQGGNAGAIFNAANEVAVEHFLARRIAFADIFKVVDEALAAANFVAIHNLDDVQAAISETQARCCQYIKEKLC